MHLNFNSTKQTNPVLGQEVCRPYPHEIKSMFQEPRTKVVGLGTYQAFMFLRKWLSTVRNHFKAEQKASLLQLFSTFCSTERLGLPSRISYPISYHSPQRLPIPTLIQFQPAYWTCPRTTQSICFFTARALEKWQLYMKDVTLAFCFSGTSGRCYFIGSDMVSEYYGEDTELSFTGLAALLLQALEASGHHHHSWSLHGFFISFVWL